MLGITNLAAYLAGVVVIVLLPGPNSLHVLSTAARGGSRAGLFAAAGIALGDTALMVLTAAGAGAALRALPAVFMARKYAGAAYLAWLAVGLLRGALRRLRVGGTAAVPAAPMPAAASIGWRSSARAMAISLSNPKGYLFCLSFFVQFVDPGYAHPTLTFVALGAILQSFSIAYLATLVFAGTRLARWFAGRRRLGAALSATAALLFVGFGLQLVGAAM